MLPENVNIPSVESGKYFLTCGHKGIENCYCNAVKIIFDFFHYTKQDITFCIFLYSDISVLFSPGILKIWDFLSCKCVFEMPLHEGSNDEEKEASTYAIVQAELCEDIQCVAVVTADHNIILFSFDGLEQNKQVFNIKVNIWFFNGSMW